MILNDITQEELHRLSDEGQLMNGADSVRYIVVHCTATRADRDYPVEQLERDHKLRGFRKIGYHFYIRKDGTLSQHRYLLEVGAHCKPFNRCSVGVCYEGGIGVPGKAEDTRTAAQKARMRELITELKTLFPQAVVMGHRDMPGVHKDCPCFDAEYEYRNL